MRKYVLLFAILVTSIFASSYVTPVFAQAARTWVSGVGDDANPCSRTAPCKTFAGAISKTAAGGEINCLDPGGFGGVTIVKSMMIKCDGVEGGVQVQGTNGITINGAGVVVYLSGLDLEGLGETGTGAINGINFVQGAALQVVNSVIRGFNGGFGINFVPATGSPANLVVSDTIIVDNGSGATGGGILIEPGSGTGVVASIDRTTLTNNALGVRADSTNSSAGVSVSIANSKISSNALAGINSFAGIGPTNVMVSNTLVAGNGQGLKANGALAALRIGNSTVTGNATATTILNSATINSFGTNQIMDNTSAGSAIPVISQQ